MVTSIIAPPAEGSCELPFTLEEPPPLTPYDMSYIDAVAGKELYNFFGNRVLERTTSKGTTLAIKYKPIMALDRSEADMMHYAAARGVLAPKVLGVYDIVGSCPIARTMVSERVPGVPLADIWLDLDEAQQSSFKDQLRAQLMHMRACTQPFIGRLGNQKTRNPYDRIILTHFGPFPDEKAFDEWCLARLTNGPVVRWKSRRMAERERQTSSSRFVLTHGDLTPRNILVRNGVITGIVDWEKSGFFPKYAEYAFAMALCHEHEDWWIPVLEEVLQPCSKERLKFIR